MPAETTEAGMVQTRRHKKATDKRDTAETNLNPGDKWWIPTVRLMTDSLVGEELYWKGKESPPPTSPCEKKRKREGRTPDLTR